MKETSNKTAWALIVKSLEKWREKTLNDPEKNDPAITTIAEEYADGPGKPWAILVSTILSLRTKDDVTRITSKRLLEKAPDPMRLLSLDIKLIESLIYPAGFYRNKAASLVKIADILISKYGGEVPADMEILLSLPGVGRKTANLVITEAFGIDGICVDIHVHRICNRAGWIAAPTPDKSEFALREKMPQKYWRRINGLLVLYGQNVCRPASPFCSRCVINSHCLRIGVDKSR